MKGKEDHIALIEALKKDDSSAFEEIYDLYKRPLYNLALRYLKDQQLAEDAVQEVFVKLWQKRFTIDEQRSLKSFLNVCLKNHVLNMIRTRQNRIKSAMAVYEKSEKVSNQTESEIAFNDLQVHFNRSVRSLSARKRKIAHMSLVEGFSNQEIATTLQISESAVRSQLSQAKKLIRYFLKANLAALFTLLF